MLQILRHLHRVEKIMRRIHFKAGSIGILPSMHEGLNSISNGICYTKGVINTLLVVKNEFDRANASSPRIINNEQIEELPLSTLRKIAHNLGIEQYENMKHGDLVTAIKKVLRVVEPVKN